MPAQMLMHPQLPPQLPTLSQIMETTSGAPPLLPLSPDGDESSRGRRRDRDEAYGQPAGDGGDGGDGGDAAGSSRKRRRSRKGQDKKFECPHEGCGKSYSRAEHLYRHQLNRKCSRARCSAYHS